MEIYKSAKHTVVDADKYTAHIDYAAKKVKILRHGAPYFDLPFVSALGSLEKNDEQLTIKDITFAESADKAVLDISADSDIWGSRKFQWRFFADFIEHQHFTRAGITPGRCYYFSRGEVQAYGNGTTGGIGNTILPHTSETMFLPTINHANRYYDTFGEPHELGVKTELARHPAFHPYQEQNGLFCPPPLCMCFKGKEGWAGLGIGTAPGNYRFNGLIWSGYFFSGATLYVDYKGFTTFDKGFESPVLSIVFGYDEYAALAEHIRWCDRNGFSTAHAYPNARWHRMPVFCGWDEQCVLQYQTGIGAGKHCTQENYEKWIEIQEKRGLPFGTVVIDDKWMKNYGLLDVDTDKWPDMKGFIAREHDKGRHVLLWIPYCQTEGLDKSVCVLVDGKPVCADAGNPEYEKILRRSVSKLIGNIGADGFKVDWVGGVRFDDHAREGIEFSRLYGIEFLHRFHSIVYDEAHRIKPDAMIETQTPNPLFRDCSDVLRLNDVFWSSRDVSDMMRIRARIARIAGWKLVDCDSVATTTMREWWRYCQDQVEIGIPSLYFVTRTQLTAEYVPEDIWAELAALWQRYIDENV